MLSPWITLCLNTVRKGHPLWRKGFPHSAHSEKITPESPHTPQRCVSINLGMRPTVPTQRMPGPLGDYQHHLRIHLIPKDPNHLNDLIIITREGGCVNQPANRVSAQVQITVNPKGTRKWLFISPHPEWTTRMLPHGACYKDRIPHWHTEQELLLSGKTEPIALALLGQ